MVDMEQEAIIERLVGLIRSTVPDAESLSKYGGTLFTLYPEEKEGQFCGVFASKNHVNISFSDGHALADPRNVLLGSGKFRRHVSFSNAGEIDSEALIEFLQAAAELSRSMGK